MISRHIPVEPENDNYGRLARYLARIDEYSSMQDAPMLIWCSGCVGGEDYAEGIAEVQDTQALNTRSQSAKTYHLVVSFRPEDEAKLTPDIFKEIEARFAKALGLSEHQRHCAVHTDTQNIHMQIAYNLIHPLKLTRNDYAWDYNKRDALCREIEREYGLVIDNGMEQERDRNNRRNERATALEARQGLQSFDSYVRERKDRILATLETAQNWQSLHRALHRYGLAICPRGNGLIIKNRHGKHALKASDVDRSLSKSRLEKVLGAYAAPLPSLSREESRYRSRPVQHSPESDALFALYQAEAIDRRQKAECKKIQQANALVEIREKWRLKRDEIEQSTMLKQNRRKLIQYARKKEAAEFTEARALFQRELAASRYESWNDFLRRHADQGNEIALTLLSSRKKPEKWKAPPSHQDHQHWQL